jgi:anti-repressor protein
MNSITPFNFESLQVRVVSDKNGEPWFVATDVCEALGLETHVAMRRLDDDEKGRCSIPTPGGIQDLTTVNESGLYSLILGSRKPEAKRFKKWITSEVLPSIRKTGGYGVPQVPQSLPEALRLAADLAEKVEEQTKLIEQQKPAVEFVKKYVDGTGLKSFREMAKILEANEREFRQFLTSARVLYKLNGSWVPYEQHILTGRMVLRTGVSELNKHAYTSPRFTAKGVQWIAGMWGVYKAALSQASIAMAKQDVAAETKSDL